MAQRRVIVVLLALLCAVASADWRALTLAQAKKRNPQVAKLLRKAKGRKRKWVKFLLRSMPTTDLVSLNADSLLAELTALDSALALAPWTKEVPENLFMHYVLPYRVSQEPLEYFRKNHWREVWERVKDCSDLRCAVYRLNEWAYEQMKYEPTSRWDQTAEQTLRRGIGRCEEMAMLFIKACRAVGIPARDVYTPYWPFTNSNHAWVEVWTGDGWHFLGGAEMTPLDNAWFDKASKRAAVIKGIAWGKVEDPSEPVYFANDGFTILNLTANYTDTTGLFVTVFDSAGEPAESADVWISVFNFSSLRPVAHHYTDSAGKAHFVVGKADLFVSAGKDSAWDFQIVPFTVGDGVENVTLVLSRRELPDTAFWLRVRERIEVERDTTYKPPKTAYLRHDLVQERLEAVPKEVLSCIDDSSLAARFLTCINRARGNRESLLSFWRAHPNDHKDILDLWEAMSDKDLLVPDSAGWEVLWSNIREMRERSAKLDVPDSLFWNYVANPRILWENFGFWQSTVWRKVRRFSGKPDELAQKVLEKVVLKLDTLSDKSYFGGVMNPAQVLRARTGSRLERLGVFVAAMRLHGVPARIAWDYEAAEYFDGKEWRRVALSQKKEERRRTSSVDVLFSDGGFPRTQLDYYDDFALVKLSPEGRMVDITPPKEARDSVVVFKDVPEGSYAFVTGWRNAKGDAFVRITPFAVPTEGVVVPTGLPPVEAVEPGDLVVRKFRGLNTENLRDISRRRLREVDWREGKVVVAFFETKHESSISTAKRLAKVEGVRKLIFVETESAGEAKRFCRQNGLKGRIFFGTEERLKSVVKFKRLPSILLLVDAKPLLWTEGINLNIDKQIESLIGRLSE